MSSHEGRRRRWVSAAACIAVAALVLLLAAPRVHARPPFDMEVHVLKVPGRVLDIACADIDGDGYDDIVVAHLNGDGDIRSPSGLPQRYISVFLQGPAGSKWNSVPSATRNVPEDAVAFAAGDFDPRSPGGEVVFLGSNGLTMLEQGPDRSILGTLAPISSALSFFDYPAAATLPRWDLAVDLGEGRDDLLLPTKEGYQVFRNSPTRGLEQKGLIRVPSNERFGPQLETQFLNRFLTYVSTMPRVVAIDLNADKRVDLVVYRKHGLARFLQKPDGTFGEAPDEEKPLAIVEEADKGPKAHKDKEGGKDTGDAFTNVRLSLVDLNHDGYADLVATKTIGEIGIFETLRTQVMVWMGGPKGWNEGKPDRILNEKGVAADPVFVDWNGDGNLDLVVSSFRMDHFTNLKRAITKSMTITYSIYLFKPDEVFSPEPDFTRDVDVDLEALERRAGSEHALFEADMNGDHFRDMIARNGSDKLQIVPGGMEEGIFSGKKLALKDDDAAEVSIPQNADIEVHDLYKDGRGDAILVTNPGPEDPDRAVVRVIEVRR